VTKFVSRDELFGFSIRLKAPGISADIIPKWKYIRTPRADMNKLYASFGIMTWR